MIRSEAGWKLIAAGGLKWIPSSDSLITMAFAASFRFESV